MDPTIQSQIQSPLVRTLQSIPTNSSNFVHGIPDNTPPFSKSTINLEPYESSPGVRGKFKFKIPQGGHLNGLMLKYRMFGQKSDTDLTLRYYMDSPHNFGNGIEKIELRARTDIIETIYPTALPFEVLSQLNGEQMAKNTLQGLAGYRGATLGPTTLLSPPRYQVPLPADTHQVVGRPGEGVVQDFLVPVPLSSTMYLKDNFQTRLLEDLELVVYMRAHPVQVGGNYTVDDDPLPADQQNKHEMSLRVDFLNFHENVEEVIRNENFKPNVPAALLQSDHLQFRAKYVSQSASSGVETLKYSVDLNTDALVTDIFVAQRLHPASVLWEGYTFLQGAGIEFELVSGGETIVSGTKAEFDGVMSRNYSTVTRQYQNEGVLPLRWSNSGTHIRLGLNNTDEFFDGGVSFQSLVSPKLIITVRQEASNPVVLQVDEGSSETVNLDDAPTLLEFDVILKRKVMLRIDGNTGKISKSLES